MTATLIGKEVRDGASKETGEKYSYIVLHYTRPFPANRTCDGLMTKTVNVYNRNPIAFNICKQLQVGEPFEIEFDENGYLLEIVG